MQGKVDRQFTVYLTVLFTAPFYLSEVAFGGRLVGFLESLWDGYARVDFQDSKKKGRKGEGSRLSAD